MYASRRILLQNLVSVGLTARLCPDHSKQDDRRALTLGADCEPTGLPFVALSVADLSTPPWASIGRCVGLIATTNAFRGRELVINRFVNQHPAPCEPCLGTLPVVDAGVYGTCFLVAPDVIATAAHVCSARTPGELAGWRVTFRYETLGDGLYKTSFSPDEIFALRQHLGSRRMEGGQDWALFRLDRIPNAGTTPCYLKVGDSAQLAAKLAVATVGHPLGLPKMRAASRAVVLGVKARTFTTTLDVFKGMSGAPVIAVRDNGPDPIGLHGLINARPGVADDFVFDTAGSCYSLASLSARTPYLGSRCTRAEVLGRALRRSGAASC